MLQSSAGIPATSLDGRVTAASPGSQFTFAGGLPPSCPGWTQRHSQHIYTTTTTLSSRPVCVSASSSTGHLTSIIRGSQPSPHCPTEQSWAFCSVTLEVGSTEPQARLPPGLLCQASPFHTGTSGACAQLPSLLFSGFHTFSCPGGAQEEAKVSDNMYRSPEPDGFASSLLPTGPYHCIQCVAKNLQ